MGVVARQDTSTIRVRRAAIQDAVDALNRATNSARSAQRLLEPI